MTDENIDDEFYFPIWTAPEVTPARSVDVISCYEKIISMKPYHPLIKQYITTFEKKREETIRDPTGQNQKNIELYTLLIAQFTQIYHMMTGDESAFETYIPSIKDIKVLKCIEDQINARKKNKASSNAGNAATTTPNDTDSSTNL
jgi:hypothetical protein